MTGSTGATLLPKGHERRLSRRQTWAYVCLGTVTFAITTMIAVCAINAGALIGQPFAGFLFNQNLKVAMTGTIPVSSEPTFYTRFGELFALCCILLSMFLLWLTVRRALQHSSMSRWTGKASEA